LLWWAAVALDGASTGDALRRNRLANACCGVVLRGLGVGACSTSSLSVHRGVRQGSTRGAA